MPLAFERNDGQADSTVRFRARGPGYSILFGDDDVFFLFSRLDSTQKPGSNLKSLRQPPKVESTDLIRMHLVDASSESPVHGESQLPGTVNYIFGDNAANWRTGIPTFSKVKYESIYPGINLVYYGVEQNLEFDFAIAPDASPQAIKLEFEGARKLKIDSAGNLVISAAVAL